MLLNDIKLALRQLRRERLTTALLLAGVTLGIASFSFILRFVLVEKSYDRWLPNASRLRRVSVEVERNGRAVIRSAAEH